MKQQEMTFRERLARRVWLFLVTGSAKNRLFLPATPTLLEQRHLEKCRVVCHRQELISRLALPDKPRVAELGVFRGDFSQTLLDRLAPSELHLIDLDLRSYDIAGRFADEIARGIVHLHEADSSTTIASFPAEYFDLIYIDGDHSYDGVHRDIEASAPRVTDRGYLVFNDYTRWSLCENLSYGTMQAINEFCIEQDWEATHFALDGYMYCDIALRRFGIVS